MNLVCTVTSNVGGLTMVTSKSLCGGTSIKVIDMELKEAAENYGQRMYPKLCNGCKHVPVDSFEAGAKWQRERDKV